MNKHSTNSTPANYNSETPSSSSSSSIPSNPATELSSSFKSSHYVVLTPTSTSSSASTNTPPLSTAPPSIRSTTPLNLNEALQDSSTARMDNARDNAGEGNSSGAVEALKSQQVEPPSSNLDAGNSEAAVTTGPELDPTQQQLAKKKKKRSRRCKKHGKKDKCCDAKKAGKKREESSEESESDESDEEESTESESESSSESEDEREKRRRKKKTKARKKAAKAKAKKRKSKSKYHNDSSSDNSSDESESSDSESESEDDRRRRRKSKRSQKPEESSTEEETADDNDAERAVNDFSDDPTIKALLAQLQLNRASQGNAGNVIQSNGATQAIMQGMRKKVRQKKKDKKKPGKRGSTLEYKRVDQLWDTTIHNYKLTESVEEQIDEFDEYVFTVRRKFDWENKYRNTVVDIKSKILRDALQTVMKDVKGVSLVEEQPSVDPNMLFLYLEELKTYYKKTLKAQLKKGKKNKKHKKRIQTQIAHCKLLAGYLDKDYEETKKTLYPMLKSGNITFDLLWALFKPNTLAYTPTYGSAEDPRCFKVDYANKESSFIRGEWYCIEGRYLEYDGKQFGLGDFEVNVEAFKGPRKITSLSTYPLQYHKDPEGVKQQLIERGKKFVALQGMNYRFHKGLAFMKKKKAVAKVNINGRVMVDPAIFRRINPNYPISFFKPKLDESPWGSGSDSASECSNCCGGSDSESENPAPDGEGPLNFDEEQQRTKIRVIIDKDDKVHVVQIPLDEEGNEVRPETLEGLEIKEGSKQHQFTEEELLIASPVVLGFAFSEKLWLEFSLSGIRDIEWNDQAFSSLVLPDAHKDVVKGMVSSHKFHAAETIDDVVQGKGRGMVFVLHGPPGVGKTLTAEGIAEYLKCPLYAVSAGELGTDSRMLEHELNKIMDIAHSWGAVLLLDEADVFLEKREVHDIHRNALVSVFLRLLEYFQGILFLTTNRVETFDDAFQSRIHVALRYGPLEREARKKVWETFIEKVRVSEGLQTSGFREKDFEALARKDLNGRQIKNAVRTAQSIALFEEKPVSMKHVERVLAVADDFDIDMKGGYGYRDAMKQYT